MGSGSAWISTSLATSGMCWDRPLVVVMMMVEGAEPMLGTTDPTDGTGEAMRGDMDGMCASWESSVTPAWDMADCSDSPSPSSPVSPEQRRERMVTCRA